MVEIVHVISDLDTGGAEVMLAKLVRGMDREKFSNTVVSLTDRGQLASQIESSGVTVHTLGMKRGKIDLRALPRLIRLLRDNRPSLVQSWLYHADLLCTVATRFVHPLPLVWNIRCSEMEMSRYGRLSKSVVSLLSRLSRIPHGIIVNSHAGRLGHERLGYRPASWHLIPNGFDLDLCRPDQAAQSKLRKELDLPDQAVCIGLVARYDPMKDHRTFIAAAKIIHAALPDVHFVLCGKDIDGTNERLTQDLASYELQDMVHLLGHRKDVLKVTAGLDIACSASIGEGFPNTIGEAMACGVPCVATNVGDSARIIGDTGRIVPPKDPGALAKACMELIELDVAGRRALGAQARVRIEEHFDIRSIVVRYEELYMSLANATSRAS